MVGVVVVILGFRMGVFVGFGRVGIFDMMELFYWF